MVLLNVVLAAAAQDILVTFDKTKDFSAYKTFRVGESEVITPKDKRIIDEKVLRQKVDKEIIEELTRKKLQPVDSNAQLVVSYIIGMVERSDVYDPGPLGGTPGLVTRATVVDDFNEGTFVVDLNDRSTNLIWRIEGKIRYTTNDIMQQVDEVLEKGFKKFPNKLKVKKK